MEAADSSDGKRPLEGAEAPRDVVELQRTSPYFGRICYNGFDDLSVYDSDILCVEAPGRTHKFAEILEDGRSLPDDDPGVYRSSLRGA